MQIAGPWRQAPLLTDRDPYTTRHHCAATAATRSPKARIGTEAEPEEVQMQQAAQGMILPLVQKMKRRPEVRNSSNSDHLPNLKGRVTQSKLSPGLVT